MKSVYACSRLESSRKSLCSPAIGHSFEISFKPKMNYADGADRAKGQFGVSPPQWATVARLSYSWPPCLSCGPQMDVRCCLSCSKAAHKVVNIVLQGPKTLFWFLLTQMLFFGQLLLNRFA